VIIDAVKESRRIVQRMNSYAIYRIAETLRVLLFVTLAILVFNFFPVTAIMIVILALLNDGSILSIAYDNVHYKDQPEAWNMRLVIGMATVLGVVGPIAAFGLFLIGDEVFHLGHPQLQTLMYLMLSLAGSMTIYLTRTRGPFWSIRPARILVLAVTGAELIATALALSGVLVPRLGWNWVLLVWGYAIIWFLISDRVKLAAYKILDPPKNQGVTHAGLPATEPVPGPDPGHEAVPAAKPASFHTSNDAGDQVYHDSGDCPYGQEIRRDGNDEPGTGGGRRCDWCARHPVSA
jgi:H+-transporting ATPase